MNVEAIGQRIDGIRKARKWTYKELAKRMGDNMSQQTVSNHIKVGRMNTEMLCRYAEALGCTVADLTDGAVALEDFELKGEITDYYPYNLAAAIFGEPCEVYTPNLIKALDDNWFTDRERKIIELRYKSGLTLEETGKKFGVTRERIREIEHRALRKLRHPRLSKHYHLDTLERYYDAVNELSNVRLENIQLHNKLDSLTELANRNITPEELDEIEKERERKKSAMIDEMELSVRSWNCLCRANIRYVKDLEGMTIEKLAKVRNLGRKSMNEVIAKAAEWGIEIKSEVEA